VKRAASALLLLASVPAQAALPSKLPPVDRCKGDAAFEKFRNQLRAAVAKKDRGALLALLAPDVLINFGGENGPAAFAKQWSFDAKEYGNVWDQLNVMIRLGCAPSEQSRIIPSMTVQLERHDADDLYDFTVILPGAKLYKSVGVESSRPATTGWELAKITSRAADWGTGVKLADGREGYIADDHLYEPLGYRMVVEKRKGKWMITAFVAGD